MSEQKGVFRGAAFGGFNREDVLSYIRKLTEEHQKETAELQTQLDAVTDQRNWLQSQVKLAETAGGKLPELESQVSALTGENDRLKAENESLRAEQARLQAQISDWTPSMTTYGAVKSQLAEIELSARQRSTVILRQAEEQSEEMCSQARRAVQHTADWYDKTRAETNRTLDYLCGELERIRGELQALSAVMDSDGRSLFLPDTEEENHE